MQDSVVLTDTHGQTERCNAEVRLQGAPAASERKRRMKGTDWYFRPGPALNRGGGGAAAGWADMNSQRARQRRDGKGQSPHSSFQRTFCSQGKKNGAVQRSSALMTIFHLLLSGVTHVTPNHCRSSPPQHCLPGAINTLFIHRSARDPHKGHSDSTCKLALNRPYTNGGADAGGGLY